MVPLLPVPKQISHLMRSTLEQPSTGELKDAQKQSQILIWRLDRISRNPLLMTANQLSLAMLLRVSRASTPNTATNQVTFAVSTSRAIIRISIRSALAWLKERSSSASLRLTTIGERIVADGARTFIRAGNTVVEEGLVAARDYGAGAGASDGNGVTLDVADVYEGRVDAVKRVEAGFDHGASANNGRV